MEYVDRIFYRKINPSDFKKLYDLDRPENGGGQTYLEAAGISNEDIVDFLAYAEISDSPLNQESRSIFSFNAYVLGSEDAQGAFIEFAPRGGRNNYRISRQNMRYKHKAWSPENGFPEPQADESGNYISSQTFEGIIDNLVIIILRTTYKKYYAGYINTEVIPDTWPKDIGLESIFSGERRGVLNLYKYGVKFANSLECPFASVDPLNRVVGGTNVILYGVPGAGKSWTIDHEYCNDETRMDRLVFHPDYMYSDFIGQILPIVDKEENKVRYDFVPGPFTKILKKAWDTPDKEFYLIIEEINRGNAPAIFGEVFQLLDRIDQEGKEYPVGTSEYAITNANVADIVYKDPEHKIRIPSNLSIIGTMNTSDQNVFTLDTAFQRRWSMRMIPNSLEHHRFANKKILDTDITWGQFCTVINDIILKKCTITSSEDKRLGAYFVSEADLELDPKEYDANADQNEIIKAKHNNARFAEKVLKYLWDDAFKFSHPETFNKSNNSLESVVKTFCSVKGNKRFNVFHDTISGLLYEAAGIKDPNAIQAENEVENGTVAGN